MIGEELIQVLREALCHAGHFVRVDLVKNAQGALVLNRFFVATRWMQEQYKLFGKVTLLDSSYGKNRELMPIQGFIGLTSERHLTIFGFASTRSETKYDFEWLFETFSLCYQTLSRTWITDGDEKIYESLSVVAKRHCVTIAHLLCIWHLFRCIERNFAAFDSTALKSCFFTCRAATTESEF